MSKAFRLGVFIVATLLIFAAGVFWVGSKQFLFSSTYRLNADFPNVSGLTGGAEVRVGGVRQGTVKRIDLPRRPDEKMRVVMDLKGATRDVIKKDSVAAIKSEGLVGDKYVEISFGSNEARKVSDGDAIPSEPPLDISDLVKKTNIVLDSAQRAVHNIEGASGNLNIISSKVNRGAGTMGALVNDKTLYREVNAGATAFHENMEALKHNFLLRGFFKKRGYEDAAELTRHAVSQLPASPIARRFAYDAGRIFDKADTAKLRNEKVLKDAGRYLEQNPFGLAIVAASTDRKGDSEKDRALTAARAMVVREYLVQNFQLDDTRVKTIGLGKSGEIDQGGRVEILVYPVGTNAALAQGRAAPKKR